MTEPGDLTVLAKRRRWRRLLWLLVPLAVVAAAWVYMYFASDRRLAQAVAEAERRTRALLRSAAAGLAAERYRRKNGRWPESLDELKGEFLRDVPLDPYDGKPLRYRRDGEGVIIYAIWKDRQDDGGDRATLNTYKDGTDVGFRLWDVDKRRQVRK